jgi:hypothetical protein
MLGIGELMGLKDGVEIWEKIHLASAGNRITDSCFQSQ